MRPNPPTDPAREEAILRLARERPELGQASISRLLCASGLRISPSGVRYVLQRYGLETQVKRLRALVRSSPKGVESLDQRQRALLARGALSEDEAAEDAPPRDRKTRILDAAAELFFDLGYDGTSIRDIAGKVGLLPGSVYHYFPSKEELYLAVHRTGITRVEARIKAAIADLDDPWERLRVACEVHVAGIVEGSPVDRITGRNLALVGKHNLLKRITPFRKTYENLFRELIEDLPVAPDTDRSLLRLFLLGGMNWACLWYRRGIRSPEEIADIMLDMVRQGVQSTHHLTQTNTGDT